MKHITSGIKFVAALFFFVVLVFILFPLKNGTALKKADADSLDVYPGNCLGGWQDPSSAAGPPDGVFAELDDTQAQLFCGSFEGSDQSQQPQAVTLYFSWNVTFPGTATTTTTTSTGSGDTSWTSILDSTTSTTATPSSTASSSSSGSSESGVGASSTATTTVPTATTTASSSPSSQVGSPAATSTDMSEENDGASSTPLAAPSVTTTTDDTSSQGDAAVSSTASAPASPPSPAPTDGSSTSLLNEIFREPFALLARQALADSSGTVASDTPPSDAFLDVSYSVDGVTWQDLGDVDAENWQNFSVTIPVSSWSDINSLQIRLTPLLTADPPTIDLDSMWLEVDYDSSITDIIQQSTDDTLNALSDIGTAIDNTLSDILPGNASDTQSEDLSDATTSPPQAQPQIQPQSAPAVPRYSFQASGGTSIDAEDLSWVPAEDLKNYDASATAADNGTLPTVTVVGGSAIRVAGTCSEAYYTILLFANQSDYSTNPASALLNVAEPCVGGSFAQTIEDSDLPPQLASGTYYLVVANQPAKGPWQPFPQIYPITIGNLSSSQ